MVNKIFLVLLAIAVLLMAVLTFLALSQLKSIGFPPNQIVQHFADYESVHWTVFWISSLLLLILSNVILWTERQAWALWSTFLFFALFIMVNTWWLTESLANYQKLNNLDSGGLLSKNGIFGAIFCIAGGIVIFFNQFITLRLRDKMFEQPREEIATGPSETVEVEAVGEKPKEPAD